VREIRESTKKHLRANGCPDVPVFLIDNYMQQKFEFDQLEHRLIEEFPDLKRSALVLSLQATGKEMIQLKVAELRSRMWILAGLSAVVAAVPIPGLSLAFDLGVVAEEAHFYFTQLGLDETSLKRYAKFTSADYQQLKYIVTSLLGFTTISFQAVKNFIIALAELTTALVASSAVEEASRFIPLIGPFIAAPLSFAGTCYALKLVRDKMESVALEVVTAAAKSATATEDSDNG